MAFLCIEKYQILTINIFNGAESFTVYVWSSLLVQMFMIVISLLNNILYYCCPIKKLQRHKNRADFICDVSPFLLDFCRQTKSIQLWAKVYILADSRYIVRS